MPKKILVVEDNLDTRELIHLQLTTEGFNVVIAANGREGVYMAGAEHPDLIITDIQMPELSGLAMISQLREQPEFENIPILVLTAFGDVEIDAAIRAGANRAMNKPVLLEALTDEVREMLAESKNRPPTR
jgi:two-component system alkaline phosphatase synthesis response regulator PhoP